MDDRLMADFTNPSCETIKVRASCPKDTLTIVCLYYTYWAGSRFWKGRNGMSFAQQLIEKITVTDVNRFLCNSSCTIASDAPLQIALSGFLRLAEDLMRDELSLSMAYFMHLPKCYKRANKDGGSMINKLALRLLLKPNFLSKGDALR